MTPPEQITKTIVDALNAAKAAVSICQYSWTETAIAATLARAACRGVRCRVILDKADRSHCGKAIIETLAASVAVRCTRPHRIMHAKIVIIDATTVMIGSANFTWPSLNSNAEVWGTITDASQVEAFAEAFEKEWDAAEPIQTALRRK